MAVGITDRTIVKRLVAIGNDSLYYEGTGMSAGALTKLAASDGYIDTSDYLEMCEAYQKVFIANGTNLKVADFINVKLTHSALDTPNAKGDILTQDQGSSNYAYMVVDYTNTAKTATYGYAYYGGSATAFNTDDSVSGSGSGSSFTPSVVTASPHWYDWTVYQGDTSNYGTMPSVAYLVCLYRGRVVIAGDSRHPHQWWMSKIGDPWDFNTAGTETIDAVTHANSDVGEIGDVVTALVPYKDDFLVFGCANSVWVLVGDPRAAGQLVELSLTTGIWGAKSWCFDNNNNFYFFGNDGIYRVKVGQSFSPPENISQLALPNLVNDWGLDKSLHRITMGFDPIRNGILICKTLLSDGTNENLFFSLTTQGFFPETYPEECAAYSLFFYPANDDTYKDLLVGCKDGYIRKFDETAKDDDIGAENETISSYVTLPIKLIASDEDKEGKLLWLNGITAGGALGGDFSDTDSVGWSLYVGDDAETTLEDIIDDDTEFATGTWSGTGKQNKIRIRGRGVYIGIKLANSTEDETWAINRIYADIKPVGRLR